MFTDNIKRSQRSKITRKPQGNIESQEQMTRAHQLIHENHVGQSTHEMQDTRKQILKQYEKCFGDLGTLPDEHHITLDKNVPPVIHAVRKIPYAILPNLKNELERMSKMGVIVPVGQLISCDRKTKQEHKGVLRYKRSE